MSTERDVAAAMRRHVGGSQFTQAPYQWGVVNAAHTAPNTVDVLLDGSTVATLEIRYLAGYTPTVGDTVLVGRMGSDRWVFGKLA